MEKFRVIGSDKPLVGEVTISDITVGISLSGSAALAGEIKPKVEIKTKPVNLLYID